MTTFAIPSLALGFAGGGMGFVPARMLVKVKRFLLAPQVANLTANYGTNTDLGQYENVRLGRLERNAPIVDGRNPHSKFQHDYQRNVETTEAAIRALTKGQINLTNIVQGLLEAQRAISEVRSEAAASTAAVQAQNTYNRVRDSYADENVLSASNDGGICTVQIAAHNRNYLDPQESVSVNGGTISGLGAATTYFIGYEDPDLDGGAVTFIATQNEEEVTASQSRPFIHKIGVITTPTTAGGGSIGNETRPPWQTERTLQEL